jgi:hypothetical protein
MGDLFRVTNVLGAGTYAHHLLAKLWEPCAELGALHSVNAWGRLELNRATASEPTSYGKGGIIDVSPAPAELKNAIGHAGSDEIAEQNRDCWGKLAHDVIGKVVQAYQSRNLVDGQTLWLQGFNTGHGKPADEMLRELKARLARMFVVADSVLPDSYDKRQSLKDGRYDLFLRLKNDGIVETTILTDNWSPFARHFDLDAQDRFKAKALASLLASQVQFTRNPSLAEVGRSLGQWGALCGMAFASGGVEVDVEAAGWRLLRGLIPSLPQRGSANVAHLVNEAKLATRRALTEPTALAIDETVNITEKPLYLIYTVPIRRQDPRTWIRFASGIRTWLANEYPTAVPIFVSGAGCRDPRYNDPYPLQVSVLFPMPDVPHPLAEILGSKTTKRRTAPRPAKGRENGQGTDPVPAMSMESGQH